MKKIFPDSDEFIVSEETSRHVSQVLRMKEGEEVIVTNGKGYTIIANIIYADKKKTKIKIKSKQFSEKALPKTCYCHFSNKK